MRYCPLCGRSRDVVEVVDTPFVSRLCVACGFVHSVREGAPSRSRLDAEQTPPDTRQHPC